MAALENWPENRACPILALLGHNRTLGCGIFQTLYKELYEGVSYLLLGNPKNGWNRLLADEGSLNDAIYVLFSLDLRIFFHVETGLIN